MFGLNVAGVLGFLLSLLFPRQDIPAWIPTVLGVLIERIVGLVSSLEDMEELSGEEKREEVVAELAAFVDAVDDHLPLGLSEEQSDRIIEGLAELALFIWRNLDRDDVRPRDVKRALRRASVV